MRAVVAVHAVAFQLVVRAWITSHTVADGFSLRTWAALRAPAFQLAVRAGVAVRALALYLSMRLGVAVHADTFQLAARARVGFRAVLVSLLPGLRQLFFFAGTDFFPIGSTRPLRPTLRACASRLCA